MNSRIYLDNAATSWPKPEAVYDAVDRYQRHVGAASGRSGYREALDANRIVEQARAEVARLIGAQNPSHVVFTASGTDSLNLAIQGILRPGDHVVTTVCEHNSVLRPLRALNESSDVSVSYVPCDNQGLVSAEDVREALRPETRLVAVIHASNVTGTLQPVGQIGSVVSDHGALLLVDAAQSLGYVPIDVDQMQIDLLAAPGHKGLLGPLGTGVLYIRPGIERQLRPLRFGGTGTQSDEDRQPEVMPEKYEPGNHNLPGLAGLAEGLRWLHDRGVEQVQAHHGGLTQNLIDGLAQITGVAIYGPTGRTEERTSVVSFTLDGYHSQDVAAALEASYGVQCRAGLHCAPKMHEALGTLHDGGTVRLSLGWATSSADIETTVSAIAELAAIAAS